MIKLKDILYEFKDKMSLINLKDYYKKNYNNKEWLNILQKFPEELQREIIDELPKGNVENIELLKHWQLIDDKPISVNTDDILRTTLLQDKPFLGRLPKDVVDVINKNWKTKGKSKIVYDKNPQRYFQYAKMSERTAKPSVVVNGVVEWGVGRFVAALIRGDKKIKIWNIKSK